MYRQGDVSVEKLEDTYDSRNEGEDTLSQYEYVAYLPHSCGSWIVGGKEQIEILIQDLQQILKDNFQREK